MFLFNSRLLISRIFLASVYIALYVYMYLSFLYPVYSYMGFEYNPQSAIYNFLTLSLAVLPIIFFTGVNNLSSFISILLYVLAYVPMVLTISVYDSIILDTRVGYQLILYIAQSAFFIIDKLPNSRPLKKLDSSLHINVLIVFVIAASIYIFYFYRNNMKFVNFLESGGELYEFRSENDALTEQFALNRYLITWLSRNFYPFLIIFFLIKKQYIRLGIVILATVGIFMINAGKLDFFMPFLLIGFYYFLKKRLEFVRKYFFAVLVGAIFFISILLFIFIETETGFALAAIVFLRTLGISGYLFVHYIDFFTHHPYTNFGHVNIINAIAGNYPYGNEDLGRVVFYNKMNGNANFWIMDGVAGQGILGIFVISLLFFFILIFINRLKTLYDERILYLLFLPVIMILLNVSLFTTLLTGGGLLLVLLLLIFKLPFFENSNDNLNST